MDAGLDALEFVAETGNRIDEEDAGSFYMLISPKLEICFVLISKFENSNSPIRQKLTHSKTM